MGTRMWQEGASGGGSHRLHARERGVDASALVGFLLCLCPFSLGPQPVDGDTHIQGRTSCKPP